MTVTIIAEAGVNHNGDIEVAKRLVDAAARAGADIVKFQTFKAKNLVTEDAPKAEYQKYASENKVETQFQMLKQLELTPEMHDMLIEHCKKVQIEFLSTPFDIASIDYLVKKGIGCIKIPSGEITNLPYLRKIGSFGKEVILSSGVSTPNEVLQAFEVLTNCGLRKDQITVLQCTTAYPTPLQDANVRAMLTLQEVTGGKMGYSDHTVGSTAALVAVALGAVVIEKHFTTDQKLPGPDQHASMMPADFADLVRQIREAEIAIGDGEKTVRPSELENQSIARRGVYASRDLEAGEILLSSDFVMLRPQTSVSPMEIDSIIGKSLRSPLMRHEPFDWSLVD
jgi:N,N'-diacetyllegionaminate synthase